MSNPVFISGTWNATIGGSWSTSTNWQNGSVPGSNPFDTALFGNTIGSNAVVVTMDGSRSLSSLAFNTSGTGSYTINPGTGGTLTLTNSGDRGLHQRQRRQPDRRRADQPG